MALASAAFFAFSLSTSLSSAASQDSKTSLSSSSSSNIHRLHYPVSARSVQSNQALCQIQPKKISYSYNRSPSPPPAPSIINSPRKPSQCDRFVSESSSSQYPVAGTPSIRPVVADGFKTKVQVPHHKSQLPTQLISYRPKKILII